MQSSSDLSRRGSNQAIAEASATKPLPMTPSGLATMMEMIKGKFPSVHKALSSGLSYPSIVAATAGNVLVGASLGSGPLVAGSGVAGAILVMHKIMCANQLAKKVAVAEASAHAQQRLNCHDKPGNS